MPPKTTYYCDCTAKCMVAGRTQPVAMGKTKYYSHRQFREADRLARLPPVPSAVQPIPSSGHRVHEGPSTAVSRHLHGADESPVASDADTDETQSEPRRYSDAESNAADRHDRAGGNQQGDTAHVDPKSGSEEDEDDDEDEERDDVGENVEEEDGEAEPEGRDSEDDSESDVDMDMNNVDDPGSLNNQQMLAPAAEEELSAADDPPEVVTATLSDLVIAQKFEKAIRDAKLDDCNLPADIIDRLRNPITEKFTFENEPLMRTGVELFLDTRNASEEIFTNVCDTFQRHNERTGQGPVQIPSLHNVKKRIADVTGIHTMLHDMCVNTCIAYTGPYAALRSCPYCHHPRYKPLGMHQSEKDQKPYRTFSTMPIGPQLQGLWRSPESAQDMKYRRKETEEIMNKAQNSRKPPAVYSDIYHGKAYRDAVRKGDIKENDMVLMLSIDGAQLYESKQSDCWIYIWIIFDLAPDKRYKKRYVLPGGFIPGPNKPKNVDSFLFPGLHHLSALMKEGLMVWDASIDEIFRSDPYLFLGAADGPGMTYLNGLAGHSGAFGCRLYCSCKGRRKKDGNHYYPALLKPHNYTVEGCDHPTVNPAHLPIGNSQDYQIGLNQVLRSTTSTNYTTNRRNTGISKPSIFSGFPERRTLGVPLCFGGDIMHLISLNIPDLLLNLWRGRLDCDPDDSVQDWEWAVLVGNVWKTHGAEVAAATPYLPGSFDRPPRNPAEKISSGYKAWEYLTYLFSLCPALLYNILPHAHWRNFCQLVRGVRLIHQRNISSVQLVEAHGHLVNFVTEFEKLYYQGKESRLHFCRQSLHALLHSAPEVERLGPGAGYSQWTMERAIGDLTLEMRQDSNPHANLAMRGLQRSQTNVLVAIDPTLLRAPINPRLSTNISGTGYTLLGPKDRSQRKVSGAEGTAIRHFYHGLGIALAATVPRVTKWGRLRLPNNQLVRTLWKEGKKDPKRLRMARNVSFYSDVNHIQSEIGEVWYFFQANVNNRTETLAMISVFSHPDPQLLQESHHVLSVCTSYGKTNLRVIRATDISTCVAMVPFKNLANRFFVCEKMGLAVASLREAEMNEENEDEGDEHS